MVGFEIIGLKETQRRLNTVGKSISPALNKAMKKIGPFMQNEVKASVAGRRAEKTSVDTGRFLNSILFQLGNESVKILTELDYPKALEFGTSRIKPRRHFSNSLDRNKKEIIGIIENEIKKIT